MNKIKKIIVVRFIGLPRFFASGGQGALLKNRPLDPHKTFY
jgi:hypothetical protein